MILTTSRRGHRCHLSHGNVDQTEEYYHHDVHVDETCGTSVGKPENQGSTLNVSIQNLAEFTEVGRTLVVLAMCS